MPTGTYSLCRISFEDNSDAAIYTTIKYGFDTREQAFAAIPEIANAEKIPEAELVVIRFIDRPREGWK